MERSRGQHALEQRHDLSEAALARADLRGLALHGKILVGADLVAADLRGADLHDAQMSGALLRDADASGARLCGADLARADLVGCRLVGADLQGALLQAAEAEAVDLRDADLRQAKFFGADLTEADLRGADVRGADFTGAILTDADFRGVDLSEARFSEGALGVIRSGEEHHELPEVLRESAGGIIDLTRRMARPMLVGTAAAVAVAAAAGTVVLPRLQDSTVEPDVAVLGTVQTRPASATASFDAADVDGAVSVEVLVVEDGVARYETSDEAGELDLDYDDTVLVVVVAGDEATATCAIEIDGTIVDSSGGASAVCRHAR